MKSDPGESIPMKSYPGESISMKSDSISRDESTEESDSVGEMSLTKQADSEMIDQSASSFETTTSLLLEETQAISVDDGVVSVAATVSDFLQDSWAKEKSFTDTCSKEDVVHKIDDTDGKESFSFEEKEQESEVQRLLEAEKKRLLAEIEVGSIFEKNGNGSKDSLVKRSVKIDLIDDTALVDVVSFYKKGNDHPKRPRKHKKTGDKQFDGRKDASTKLSQLRNHGENNGKQFRILYSRKQMESMRFSHIVNQKKMWSEMYARLRPEVVTEYESLVSFKNHKTSKSNLESGIGENMGTLEGTEDQALEDYADDNDDYNSILKPAFDVDGEPDFSIGPPEDGLEYLRRVRWEAKGIPNVKVAKIDGSKYRKKEQSVYMPSVPEISKCPEYLLPAKEWEDSVLSDFLHLRMALSQDANRCEDEIIPSQPVEDSLVEIFSKRVHTERDETFAGVVADIQGMDSVTRVSKLKKRISLIEKESGLESSDCKWVVALCASLETPLDADTCACLRDLLRKCASVRAEKALEVGDGEVHIMANMLITIAGRYFGQMGQ